MKQPIFTSVQLINYQASYSEPAFKNPPTFPVQVTLYNRAGSPATVQLAPTIKQDGTLVGTPGTWIQAIGIHFPGRTYGLSIAYRTTFLRVYNYRSTAAQSFSDTDGGIVGSPGPGDYYALRSIALKLTGPRSRFYEVVYKGEMVGGTTSGTIVEKKNGDFLAADGPEFNLGLTPVEPGSWIQRISVEVRKRDGK